MTDRPTVAEAVPLAREIYQRNSVGCCVHLVLDDDNLDDSAVALCVERARDEGHEDCEQLALLLVRMTRSQRGRVARARR